MDEKDGQGEDGRKILSPFLDSLLLQLKVRARLSKQSDAHTQDVQGQLP